MPPVACPGPTGQASLSSCNTSCLCGVLQDEHEMLNDDSAIYMELRESLMKFATVLVGPNDAADLVSEVVAATLRRGSLVSLDNPKAYLMQGLVNRARSAHRKTHRTTVPLDDLQAPDGIDDLIEKQDVTETVAGLPIQQRAAIYLVYWADLDYNEAAATLRVRPATLRRYLFIAKAKLRRHLSD